METLRKAFESGINYFDLASAESISFNYLGKALVDVREKVMYQIHFGANYLNKTYGWTTNLDIIKKSVKW